MFAHTSIKSRTHTKDNLIINERNPRKRQISLNATVVVVIVIENSS